MKTALLLAQMVWIMAIILSEDRSPLPEEQRACCSWTILTPENVASPVQFVLPHSPPLQLLWKCLTGTLLQGEIEFSEPQYNVEQ